jgi:hypothetical protein
MRLVLDRTAGAEDLGCSLDSGRSNRCLTCLLEEIRESCRRCEV